MRYVASREEMQNIDAYSINNVGIPGIVLMEKAALALEEVFLERIPTDSRVLIVTEKGNNGGDGLALGRLLLEEGYTVDFYEIGVIPHDSDSHQIQKHILEQMEADFLMKFPDEEYDVIVDAIFGVGLKREVAGRHREVIERLNQMEALKVAVDVPSGVDASAGQILGIAFEADITVTFGLPKVGLLLYPGADVSGEVIVKEIGFPNKAVEEIAPQMVSFTTDDLELLPERKAWTNKGSYGKVLLIAGSKNMAGAALLSGTAAYKSGSGLRHIIDHLFDQIGAYPDVSYEIAEDHVVAGFVANGFGIAVAPDIPIIHSLNLKVLPLISPSWQRNFYMATLKDAYHPPVVDVFKQFVIEQTRNNLDYRTI